MLKWQEQVEEAGFLLDEHKFSPSSSGVRRCTAQWNERGARERLKRVEAAIAQVPKFSVWKMHDNDKHEAACRRQSQAHES